MVHGGPGTAVGRIEQGLAGHRDDGRHHQVDRDHVGHALGYSGELAEQAPGVGDDDRLSHPEAANPAGAGLGQRRLDDGWSNDGHGDGGAELADQGPLAQRLGIGVGVGPAEGLGPGLADGEHLLLDPVLPEPLGPFGQQVEPAAPSSPRAALAKWARRSGCRDSASVSPRCRRAASTSVLQSTSTVNGLLSSSSSRASPWWVRAT